MSDPRGSSPMFPWLVFGVLVFGAVMYWYTQDHANNSDSARELDVVLDQNR